MPRHTCRYLLLVRLQRFFYFFQQLARIELFAFDVRDTFLVEPLLPWPVIAQLDPIAVGVRQVHCDRHPVVLRPVDRVAVLKEAPDGAGKLAAVGVQDGEVVQPRVPLRRRYAPLAAPCVKPTWWW